jgi:nucleoside-diphosphate-sugar epimerase
LIGHALLDKPDVQLRLLVRPGSRKKAAGLEARGAQVVEGTLDADAGEALAALCNGAWAVVSAVQGSPNVFTDGQTRLLEAAREAGVRRFIPSDYTMNIFGLSPGESRPADVLRAFDRHAQEERGDVEVVHVLNGAFLDERVLFGFLGAIDLEKREAYLWGEGDEKMDFTTYADTAAYTAEVAVDERAVPERFFVAGESLTFHELVHEVEAGLDGTLTIKERGSLADLDAEIDRRMEEDPEAWQSWLPLMYWRAMLNGKGKLEPLQNDRYPSVDPTGVRAYVERMGADGDAPPQQES